MFIYTHIRAVDAQRKDSSSNLPTCHARADQRHPVINIRPLYLVASLAGALRRMP